MTPIVYVTADGILQPLGHSQVVRVVERLAQRGYRYTIVSLERRADLAREGARERLLRQLGDAGVQWEHATFAEGGGPARAAANLARLTAVTARAAMRSGARLVHARAYHGALVGLTLAQTSAVRYLFDTRSYWFDERGEAGQWGPAAYRAAGHVERALFRGAAGAVALTHLQAEDLRGGRFGPWGSRAVTTIPTCADFDEFRSREEIAIAPALTAFADDGLLVGFVGSVNASYRIDRAMELARRVLDLRSDARVVALTSDVDGHRRLFDQHGIPRDRTLVVSVSHRDMPRWVPRLDWGALILKTSPSKRASMPTKLAEFFAAGVRPIHHGCNEEVADWVHRAGSGISLDDLSDDALDAAARTIATAPRDVAALSRARAVAEPHFSLASGVERYARILDELA